MYTMQYPYREYVFYACNLMGICITLLCVRVTVHLYLMDILLTTW